MYGGIILLFYVIYFYFQMKTFMSRLCPRGKMSCIGKYRRNVLYFTTTVKLALAWGFFPIFRQFVLLAYAHLDQQVSPQNVFYIDTVLWTLSSDLFYTYLNLRLRRRGIPSITETPRASNFSDLSRNNSVLEARRAVVDNCNKRRVSYPRRQMSPVGRINVPTIVSQARDEGTSETGVFGRCTGQKTCHKSLPQKFSYFSKLPKVPKPKSTVDLGEDKIEMWIDAPTTISQAGDEGTSENGSFEKFTGESKSLRPQKFSYFSKLPKLSQPKTVVDLGEDKMEMWHQELVTSSKKILFYSRHMNVVKPKIGNT